MSTIEKLGALFAKFPGIGNRQAKRFVYFLLSQNDDYVQELASVITGLKKSTKMCKSCFVHFENDTQELCDICRRADLDTATLLVVAKDSDYENIKRTGLYQGTIFVLGGLVPAIEQDVEKYIRVRELETSLPVRMKNGLQEIVLALSLTPQGEQTDHYLKVRLAPKLKDTKITVTSLGRGLSTGSELEYSDSETIGNALKNRG